MVNSKGGKGEFTDGSGVLRWCWELLLSLPWLYKGLNDRFGLGNLKPLPEEDRPEPVETIEVAREDFEVDPKLGLVGRC